MTGSLLNTMVWFRRCYRSNSWICWFVDLDAISLFYYEIVTYRISTSNWRFVFSQFLWQLSGFESLEFYFFSMFSVNCFFSFSGWAHCIFVAVSFGARKAGQNPVGFCSDCSKLSKKIRSFVRVASVPSQASLDRTVPSMDFWLFSDWSIRMLLRRDWSRGSCQLLS